MSEPIDFWSQLGYEPTIIFELERGILGFAHRKEEQQIGDKTYTMFICATLFFGSRIQHYTVYATPNYMVKKIQNFRPKRSSTLGDFLSELRRSLFREEEEKT